jgi:molecular chaperone GrpE
MMMSVVKKKAAKSKEQKQVAQLKRQLSELTADLQRVQADFTNFKRRSEEDKQRSIRFGRETAAMALLPVVDNIQRALLHVPADLAKHDWAVGVQTVAKQLEDALRGIGVEKIESVGQVFDPSLHEAIHMDGGSGDQEIVSAELQSGYRMDGEVIRHAMVKVKRSK